MNNGVEMILQRMKTHPEEFEGESGRWSRIMSMYGKFFTKEETNLLENAIHELRRDEFTRKVMEELLREQEPTVKYEWWNRHQDNWGSSTLSLQEQVLKDREKAFEEMYKDELHKLMLEERETMTKAEKNKSKMQQLLQNVTKKKQVY